MRLVRPSPARLRFDPKRTLAYHARTTTRPTSSYTLSPADLADMKEANQRFIHGGDETAPANVRAFWAWRAAALRWARGQGVSIRESGEKRPDGSVVVRWWVHHP